VYITKPKGFFTEGKGADRKVHPISEPKGHRIAHSKHVDPSRDEVYDIHVQRRLRRHSAKSKVIVLSDEEWGISKPKPKAISPPRLVKKPRIERRVKPKPLEEPKLPKKEVVVPKIEAKPKLTRTKKPKKHKIKAPKPRTKMTHIEKIHLLASAKQFNIDPQEIDNTLTYYENKKHIHEMARAKGVSEMEISASEKESKEWTSQYEEYLGNLRGELESAGYTVTEPNM